MFFNFLMPTIERFEYLLMVFNVIKAENIFSNAMTMTSKFKYKQTYKIIR